MVIQVLGGSLVPSVKYYRANTKQQQKKHPLISINQSGFIYFYVIVSLFPYLIDLWSTLKAPAKAELLVTGDLVHPLNLFTVLLCR